MPALPAPIAPWPRGMNNLADITTLPEDQVALAMNLDFEQDGSVYSRPAIVQDDDGPGVSGAAISLIGYYIAAGGVIHLVATCDGKTWLYAIVAKTWTQIWTSVAADCVQYDDNLVLICETTAGGYWDGATFTVTATMPLGSQIEVLQERFWASGVPGSANANRVWYSNQTVITPPTSIYDWTTASDFFEVSAGDGQEVTALRVAQGKLYIFRNRSTWVWSYPALPIDGELRQLDPTTGADNAWCVEAYGNFFFVMNQGYLWQFINHQYYRLNDRAIDFTRETLAAGQQIDLRVSVLGARVIVWYLGSTYVYNAITSTWSQWDSPTTRAAHFLQVPGDPVTGDDRVAYAVTGEAAAAKRVLYRIQESPLVVGAGEEIACILRTRAYSFDTPGEFKRQPYYRVEVSTADGVSGSLYPQELPPGGATIDELEGVIIDTLDFGSWDNPLVVLTIITQDVEYPSQSPVRIHVEMVATAGDIHFQRMIYEIRGTSHGTVSTGPFKIYSITPMLTLKAKARFQVS